MEYLDKYKKLVISLFYCSLYAVSLGNGSKKDADIWEEASKLFSDGLEGKLISVFEDLLSSSHPDQMVYLLRNIILLCSLSCSRI